MKMKKNLITLTAVFVIMCSMAWAAAPVYPVLFQGDGTVLDAPVNGWVDEIIDISGNGNNLISTSPVGVPNDFCSHYYYTDDGPGGAGDAFTKSYNGGNTNMEGSDALKTPEFYWEADVQFMPDAQGAGQGGLLSPYTYIIGSRSNEWGEGIALKALPNGSLQAFSTYGFGVGGAADCTTASGLVADNTWVNVGVSFENVTDGGFSVFGGGGDHVLAGRQVYSGTLKIYVNGFEEASDTGEMILNDDGFAFVLNNWGPDVGITPNLGFDNILITGQDVFVPGMLEGDANVDGVVSAGDYLAIQSAFGDTGVNEFYGDANHDGVVSAADFAAVQANYGSVTPVGLEIVPEPVTLSLLAIGGIALITRKRRNLMLIFVMVLLFMSSSVVAQTYDISLGTAAIDADLTDWVGAQWFDVDTVIVGGAVNLSSGKMAVKWDTNNIYMAVTYDDADLRL
jgi:hypothetical protein